MVTAPVSTHTHTHTLIKDAPRVQGADAGLREYNRQYEVPAAKPDAMRLKKKIFLALKDILCAEVSRARTKPLLDI